MIPIKTAAQLDRIRTSCHMLAEVLELLARRVTPELPVIELDRIARREIATRGGRPSFLGYQGYPSALCVSVNETVIHGIPNDYVLQDGDIVGLDCGIDFEGHFSDSALTVPVGEVSAEVRTLLEVTREALECGLAAARPRARVQAIGRAVSAYIEPYRFGIVREFCGHGVGLGVHEEPQVPNYVARGPNPRLKPGMVVAIEPMVNLGGDAVRIEDDEWTVVTADRSVSAHFEHTVAIFDDHSEVLTRRAGELPSAVQEAS